MAEKIKYEDLTPAMQKAYDKENKLRKKWLIISLIVGVIFGIAIMFVIGVVDYPIVLTIFVGLLFAYGVSAIIMGVVHKRRWFINIKNAIFLIPFGLIAMYFALIPVAYMGLVYVIMDIVRLIARKPLISNGEIPKIVNTEEVAAETMGRYIQAGINEQSVSEKLNDLKQMLDNGLISKEDYEKKKAEILRNM